MRPLRLRAPAKINLVLEILRRRPDGYHQLRTVMHALELADTLTFSPGPAGIRVTCRHPGVPSGSGNLVTRAAGLMAREAGLRPRVRIRLEKRIPVAAGLGGGSSDAAAALLGLNRFWNLHFAPRRLLRLARQLGSDVPFFLSRGCALCTGRGDRVFPWPAVPGMWLVIVNPGLAVSTARIYRRINLQLTRRGNYINLMRSAIYRKNPIKIGKNLFNQLESVTAGMHPVVRRMKTDLLAAGAHAVLMSGSGPTVFGLMPSRPAGLAAAAGLRKRYPSVILTRTSRK